MSQSAQPRSSALNWASAALAFGIMWIAVWPVPKTWAVAYYDNPRMQGEPVLDQLVAPDLESEDATPVGLLARDDFSLRLLSCLRLPVSGRYQFRLTADNGARLHLNGDLVIDNWAGGKAALSNTISLEPGNYPIVVDYVNRGGPASLRVEMAHNGVHTFRSLRDLTEHPRSDGQCDTF